MSVKRSYSSTRRQAQARETRRSILDAALELFVANGYAATSIQAIAERAGVAVQTVYAVFGTKRELLRQLIETTITGDDESLPITERPEALSIAAEPDAHRRAELDAALSRAITERVGPIVTVAEEAAASDPERAAMMKAVKGAGSTRWSTPPRCWPDPMPASKPRRGRRHPLRAVQPSSRKHADRRLPVVRTALRELAGTNDPSNGHPVTKVHKVVLKSVITTVKSLSVEIHLARRPTELLTATHRRRRSPRRLRDHPQQPPLPEQPVRRLASVSTAHPTRTRMMHWCSARRWFTACSARRWSSVVRHSRRSALACVPRKFRQSHAQGQHSG